MKISAVLSFEVALTAAFNMVLRNLPIMRVLFCFYGGGFRPCRAGMRAGNKHFAFSHFARWNAIELKYAMVELTRFKSG